MPPRRRSGACAQMLLLVMVMVTMRATTVAEETTTEEAADAEGLFTTPSEYENLEDLKCPELDPYVASPCAFLCGSCPEGQICCTNNCGGTECMEPAKPHIPSEKEDTVTTEPTQEWTYSGTESSPSIQHENTQPCPPAGFNLSHPCSSLLQCEENWSCPKYKICCPNDCGGKECTYPMIIDLFPLADEEDFTEILTTEPTDDGTTREPANPSVFLPQHNTRCPPVHQNLSHPCGDFPQCEDDTSCPEEKICCPNDCGGVECRYPVIKGPPPPIGEEVKIVETESTTQTPQKQSPYILPFLVYGPGSYCPKLDPRAPSICQDMCNPWTSGCPRGQVCCLNNCGAGECMDAIFRKDPAEEENESFTPKTDDLYDEIPEAEYEEESSEDSRSPALVQWSPLCPKLDLRGAEPCRTACSPLGDSCPQGRVCCPNKCGYGECKDPGAKEQPSQKEKEKFFWELYSKNTVHQYEKNFVN